MTKLNLNFIRKQFPALNSDWIFMDNAGGTQVVRQVGERIQDYLYNSNVQLGASYATSQLAGERVAAAQLAMAQFVNADEPEEIILGSSTTQLLQNLSKSLVRFFKPGDEVIVTNCDHEANIGPWLNMEMHGINIKTWKINPETLLFDLEDLGHLMTEKTRLVAFTHTSNILGTINPVKEITSFVHKHGALVCVDGVAFAPHRLVDVKDLDVDFYVFSLYKIYGPHYSLLYGKNEILAELPNINHFFITQQETPYKFQPGNVNFELSYGLLGITDYLDSVYDIHAGANSSDYREKMSFVFELFAKHEETIVAPLIDFLNNKTNVRIIGEETSDKNIRVPTVSFIVDNVKSSTIPHKVDEHKIAIRYGDFYARRLIDDLDLSKQDGIVRVSLVHYNTIEEVDKLVGIFDQLF